MAATQAHLGPKRYRILRLIKESQRPVTKIECHRASALHEDETATTTYNAIRRVKDCGYVTVRRNVSEKPQSKTVRLIDQGPEALAAATAKLGESTATDLALAPTQPRRF